MERRPGVSKDGQTGETVSFGNLPSPHEVDPEYLNSAFDIGVTGCVRFAGHFIPYFVEQGRGSFLCRGQPWRCESQKLGLGAHQVRLALILSIFEQTYHKQNNTSPTLSSTVLLTRPTPGAGAPTSC